MCLLFCNELFFPYAFEDVDNIILGLEKPEGPNGSTLGEAVWLDPVVNWKPVQGKVQPCRIQSIVRPQPEGVPNDLVGQVIGPLCLSRWLT